MSLQLSIVIPSYNVAPYLERCLASCLHQDAADYEIIIVNDGSVDDTLAIAEGMAARHPSIRVLSQENKGLSEARNAGWSVARGDYIWFVDADDTIAENCLGGLLALCRASSPDVLALSGATVREEGLSPKVSYPEELVSVMLSGPQMIRRGHFQSVCVPLYLFRRCFLEEGGECFMPGVFHEDEEFTPKLLWRAARIRFTDTVCYYVHVRPGSLSRSPNTKRSMDLVRIADSLHDFSQTVDPADRYLISRRIVDVLNEALKLTRSYPEGARQSLQALLSGKKYLLRHFIDSRILKFRLEGIVLIAFPRHVIRLYHILQQSAARLGLSTESKK